MIDQTFIDAARNIPDERFAAIAYAEQDPIFTTDLERELLRRLESPDAEDPRLMVLDKAEIEDSETLEEFLDQAASWRRIQDDLIEDIDHTLALLRVLQDLGVTSLDGLKEALACSDKWALWEEDLPRAAEMVSDLYQDGIHDPAELRALLEARHA